MVSSNDIAEAKEISAALRKLSKKFFEDFYAKAAKAGHHPLPLEAMAALGRILTRVAEEYEEPPESPDRPSLSARAFEALLDSNLVQQSYLDAVSAYGRLTPGLGMKKAKPGRKAETELYRRISQLKAEGKTVPQMQAIFKAEGQHFSREKIESYLKTRRKSLK
jgi:hypothetical protein